MPSSTCVKQPFIVVLQSGASVSVFGARAGHDCGAAAHSQTHAQYTPTSRHHAAKAASWPGVAGVQGPAVQSSRQRYHARMDASRRSTGAVPHLRCQCLLRRQRRGAEKGARSPRGGKYAAHIQRFAKPGIDVLCVRGERPAPRSRPAAGCTNWNAHCLACLQGTQTPRTNEPLEHWVVAVFPRNPDPPHARSASVHFLLNRAARPHASRGLTAFCAPRARAP